MIQMHVWCAPHTQQGVLYTLSTSVKYTPCILCALHIKKCVHIETLLAHYIWCVVNASFLQCYRLWTLQDVIFMFNLTIQTFVH